MHRVPSAPVRQNSVTPLQTSTGNGNSSLPPKYVIVQPPSATPIVLANGGGVVKFNQQSGSSSAQVSVKNAIILKRLKKKNCHPCRITVKTDSFRCRLDG